MNEDLQTQLIRSTDDFLDVVNNGGDKMAKKDLPWVLITSPVTSYKLGVMGAWVDGVKNLSYPNIAILLCDNSEADDMYISLKPVEKKFAEKGIPFKTVMTSHRIYIRERLVEGRNLPRDVLTKREDLSDYKLSKEDEDKIRELQKIDFQYVLSLEQDVIPPVDCIEKLMECKKDAVSGIYFNTKATQDPTTGAMQTSWIPMIWGWAHPNVKEAEILIDTNIDFMTPSRCEQTAATGVGCLLVTKEAWTGINHIEDYRPRYNRSIKEYEKQNEVVEPDFVLTTLKEMESVLIEENKINTRGGVREDHVEDFSFKLKGIEYKIPLVVESRTWGFRYDQKKYACDDMFLSLDLSRNGFTLWFDSHVWCKHLHQMWDTVTMGER